MLGAIIGDIVGSRWEFNHTHNYDFELFSDKNDFTDDTICTIAIADSILNHKDFATSLREWCRRYPHPMGGYGGRFAQWINDDTPRPYGSFGNGSAMRVSAVGWTFDDEESVLAYAKASAECTHNHPEGIKGAQTVALAIHLALKMRKIYAERTITHRAIKEMILDPCVAFSEYDLNINYKDIEGRFDETCQGTVPVALYIIGRANSFIDAIRRAVSLGADADTLGAIVGSIAEVIWPIPNSVRKKALEYLPIEMRKLVMAFRRNVRKHTPRLIPQTENREYAQSIMYWKLGLGNPNNTLFGNPTLHANQEVATTDMGKFYPMPEDKDSVSDIKTNFILLSEMIEILRYGHIPESQEDHWFMACDEKTISYYRSWTGMCAFEAHYVKIDEKTYRIDRLKINKALSEFCVNGDEAGVALFQYLIIAETGGDAEKAWDNYLYVWDATDYKYSNKS